MATRNYYTSVVMGSTAGTIAVYTHTATGGNSTTPAINTVGSGAIIIAISSGPNIITDSQGNTWTKFCQSPLGAPSVTVYYCNAPLTSATHTFSNVAGFATWFIFTSTSAVTADTFNVAGIISGTSITPASITPASGSKLIIGNFCTSAAGAITPPGSPFTTIATHPFVAAVRYGASGGYYLTTATTSISATWSRVGSGNMAAQICSFII